MGLNLLNHFYKLPPGSASPLPSFHICQPIYHPPVPRTFTIIMGLNSVIMKMMMNTRKRRISFVGLFFFFNFRICGKSASRSKFPTGRYVISQPWPFDTNIVCFKFLWLWYHCFIRWLWMGLSLSLSRITLSSRLINCSFLSKRHWEKGFAK